MSEINVFSAKKNIFWTAASMGGLLRLLPTHGAESSILPLSIPLDLFITARGKTLLSAKPKFSVIKATPRGLAIYNLTLKKGQFAYLTHLLSRLAKFDTTRGISTLFWSTISNLIT